MPGVHGGQGELLDLLELNLQMFLSHRVVAGNQVWVFCKNSHCLYPLNYLSSTNTPAS